MKNTFIKYANLVIVGLMIFLSSCSKEDINVTPTDMFSLDIICRDSAKIAGFVNNVYSNVPSGYNRLSGSMVAASTDEAVNSVRGSVAEKWGASAWGPTALYDNPFPNSYPGIRKTFIFEERILPAIESYIISEGGKNVMYGQILFLRALFNFELLKRFGGYPIVNRLLYSDENIDFHRNTYDECVAYIVNLCDKAVKLLPIRYEDPHQFGRATKGAALALKSRLLLYSASPLFNDSSNPQDDIEHGNYNPQKWEDAAEAAFRVIDLKDEGESVYALYPDYENFFLTLLNNKEIIFSKIEGPSNSLEKINGPVSITGGNGATNPTLDLIDAYEMMDGTSFDWNNPIHKANPFDMREPRFYQSILYNESKWMNDITIETYEGGKDKSGNKATRTGFYLRKFLSVNARWNAPEGKAIHSFPLFRYAEILLNFAEAMNEAYGPDNAAEYNLTARQAITQIRQRAGFFGNTDLLQTVPNGDKERMREAIRKERQIELAFEEHRHLDLRRWKTAEEILNRPVHGLKITKESDGTFSYQPIEVENRIFEKHMYLYPFPQTEINRNKKLIQNRGWK